ncbi:hypothetical protein SALBM311S_05208 [Streptomyces alboniger]
MTARPLIHGRVATLRSCWSAPSSTVDGSVHMRIGTFAPGISTYDISSSFPRKTTEALNSKTGAKVNERDNGPASTAMRAIDIVSRGRPRAASD